MILDRIIPAGTTAQLFVLRSMANHRFVDVGADNVLRPSQDRVTDRCLFRVRRHGDRFGLLSVANGHFVSVKNCNSDAAPILAATRPEGWGFDAWETFEARDGHWPFDRYSIAIWAACNNKLVAAEQAGAEHLRARSGGAYAWERFRLMPVLDMAQVLTAFADRHPGKCKERTSHFDNSGLGWVHHGFVYESRPLGSLGSMNQIAITHVSDNWAAQADHSYSITDWYYLDSDRVGIAGTYDKKIEGQPMEGYGTFGAKNGNLGQPDGKVMLKLADRYMTPDMAGRKIVSDWRDWTGPNADQGGTPTTCHNVVDYIGERDTGAGKRWIISISSDMDFPQASGHSAGFPYEYGYYDLGPAEGVYDPDLGFVGYKQAYVGNGGAPTGQMAEEYYGRVVPGTFHRKVGTLFEI